MITEARKFLRGLMERDRGEMLDTTPIEVPGNSRPETMREMFQRFIREELSYHSQEAGAGTFEEEDDFDEPEDDIAFMSQYTVIEMAPEGPLPNDLDGDPKASPELEDKERQIIDTPPPAEPQQAVNGD